MYWCSSHKQFRKNRFKKFSDKLLNTICFGFYLTCDVKLSSFNSIFCQHLYREFYEQPLFHCHYTTFWIRTIQTKLYNLKQIRIMWQQTAKNVNFHCFQHIQKQTTCSYTNWAISIAVCFNSSQNESDNGWNTSFFVLT